jgi:hypothetical protein
MAHLKAAEFLDGQITPAELVNAIREIFLWQDKHPSVEVFLELRDQYNLIEIEQEYGISAEFTVEQLDTRVHQEANRLLGKTQDPQ